MDLSLEKVRHGKYHVTCRTGHSPLEYHLYLPWPLLLLIIWWQIRVSSCLPYWNVSTLRGRELSPCPCAEQGWRTPAALSERVRPWLVCVLALSLSLYLCLAKNPENLDLAREGQPLKQAQTPFLWDIKHNGTLTPTPLLSLGRVHCSSAVVTVPGGLWLMADVRDASFDLLSHLRPQWLGMEMNTRGY